MAALWMAGWLALMLIMTVAGHETMRELNVFEIMQVRSIAGFFLLYPLIRGSGGFAALKTSRLPQHVARNLIHYAGQLGWFFALTLIPIGQLVAIEFTMPIWTAILAASFLGERMTSFRIAAIVLGLVGVIVIVRPSTGEINPGQLIALGAAIGFGISMTLVKSLTRTESAVAVIFWMLVVQSAAGFFSRALFLDLAFGLCVGLVAGDCGLRHLFPLLSRAGDGVCRCERGRADGFLARSADRDRRLADLCGTARHLHRARRRADPRRQPLEFESRRSLARARRNLNGRARPDQPFGFPKRPAVVM
jgi:uncharacterized membrane protein